MMQGLQRAIESRWYGKAGWLLLLWPLTLIFRVLTRARRQIYKRQSNRLPVPVVVIGNITVGGTGKTPLLIALAQLLKTQGLRPGVVSRGYRSTSGASVRMVDANSSSLEVGDEPLLIARATECPVAIAKNRAAAAQTLLEGGLCNVILSDDGLQHYTLARDLEIVVVDAARGFGNGFCLPSGPLREPVGRLRDVDWVIRNGNYPCSQLKPWSPVPMHLKPVAWVNVRTHQSVPLSQLDWLKEPAYAVAGIGNPQRFFTTLNDLGITFFPKAFPDHHHYTAHDFAGFADETVLMTAKDAVKCQGFARENWWYLSVVAELPESFSKAFLERIQALVSSST
jgi:tetraacyldisaccharide 4'-kinase